MNKLYKYKENFGRMGNLEGVFVADSDDVIKLRKLMGSHIYLGEVLGKHSEVYASLDDVYELSDNPEIVHLFWEHVGNIGTNPVESGIDRALDNGDWGDE